MKKKFSLRNMSVKAKIYFLSSILLFCILVVAAVGMVTVDLAGRAHTSRYNNYGQGELELSTSAEKVMLNLAGQSPKFSMPR